MTDTPRKPADILIIDDSESDTTLMAEAINDATISNSVHVLHDASSAIDFLNNKDTYKDAPRPDLIFLDLKMPEFDGLEFLRVVKADPKLLQIPIIVLTASDTSEDVSESYLQHANCFIKKPANFMKFKKTVNVISDFWLGIATLPPKN